MAQNPEDMLARRIDRLESIGGIRQLAAEYSLALDMRDADALAGLFTDVRVSGTERGRKALRRWFDETMRKRFDGTSITSAGTSSSSTIPTRSSSSPCAATTPPPPGAGTPVLFRLPMSGSRPSTHDTQNGGALAAP